MCDIHAGTDPELYRNVTQFAASLLASQVQINPASCMDNNAYAFLVYINGGGE